MRHQKYEETKGILQLVRPVCMSKKQIRGALNFKNDISKLIKSYLLWTI